MHANIIDNLLHSGEAGRSFLTRGAREEMIDIAFILLFGIVMGIWFGKVKPLYSTVALILVLAAFGWFVYFSFAHWGSWLSFAIPAATLVANYAAITSFRMIFEEREKRKIRKTFSQYLSPGVIGLIEKDPQRYIRPGGETKELTVMFSDIRDFTTLSEGLKCRRTGAPAERISRRDDRRPVPKPGHARQVHWRCHHGFLGLALSAEMTTRSAPAVARWRCRAASKS